MGTFPLPESQLDRFATHLMLGYPAEEHEKEALLLGMDFNTIAGMGPVVSGSDIVRMQSEADNVLVDESILDYIMNIVRSYKIISTFSTIISNL